MSANRTRRRLAELIEFNQAHPELEGPWNDAVFEAAEATNGRDDSTGQCDNLRKATTPPVQDAINQLMADNELDAIIALTNGPAWPTNDNPDEGDLDGHFEFFVGRRRRLRCRATPTSRWPPAT